MFGETFSWYNLAESNIEPLKHANRLDCVPMVDRHKGNAELYKFPFYLSLAYTRGLIEESDCANFFFVKLGSVKGKFVALYDDEKVMYYIWEFQPIQQRDTFFCI